MASRSFRLCSGVTHPKSVLSMMAGERKDTLMVNALESIIDDQVVGQATPGRFFGFFKVTYDKALI